MLIVRFTQRCSYENKSQEGPGLSGFHGTFHVCFDKRVSFGLSASRHLRALRRMCKRHRAAAQPGSVCRASARTGHKKTDGHFNLSDVHLHNCHSVGTLAACELCYRSKGRKSRSTGAQTSQAVLRGWQRQAGEHLVWPSGGTSAGLKGTAREIPSKSQGPRKHLCPTRWRFYEDTAVLWSWANNQQCFFIEKRRLERYRKVK